jgi:hypothetical protein
MRKFNKSKKERRKWWINLTPEQKSAYLEKNSTAKALRRRREEAEDAKLFNLKYDCDKCIFKISESCINPLPNGCGYYDDGKTQGFYHVNKVHINK